MTGTKKDTYADAFPKGPERNYEDSPLFGDKPIFQEEPMFKSTREELSETEKVKELWHHYVDGLATIHTVLNQLNPQAPAFAPTKLYFETAMVWAEKLFADAKHNAKLYDASKK